MNGFSVCLKKLEKRITNETQIIRSQSVLMDLWNNEKYSGNCGTKNKESAVSDKR